MKLRNGLCMMTAACLALTGTCCALAEDKKETVYVMTDGTGAVNNVIVSEHLYNEAGDTYLYDRSTLTDIENMGGDEDFNRMDDQLVWDANGADITYEGTTDAQLPASVRVTYTLDGEEISPEELKGKSGHLTMRFDYSADAVTTINVAGEDVEIPLPFVMLSGMIIDRDCFSNVELTNGKLIDLGSITAVVTWGLPGLSDALGLSQYMDDVNGVLETEYEVPEIPEYAVLEADVTDFSLSGIYTVATDSIFSDISFDKDIDTAKAGELADKIEDLLTDLLDGAQQLYDGSAELSDGAAELYDGAQTLADGLAEIDSNSADLVDGARQLFEGILDTANATLQESKGDFDKLGIELNDLTVDNYDTEITRLMDEMLDKVEDYVIEQADAKVESAVKDVVHAEVTRQVTAAAEQKVTEAVTEAVEAEVRRQVTEGARQKIVAAITNMDETALNAAVDKQMASSAVQAQIDALVEQNMASSAVQAQIEQQLEQTVRPQVEASYRAGIEEKIRPTVRAAVTEKVKDQLRQQYIGSHSADPTEKPSTDTTAEPTTEPTAEPTAETTNDPTAEPSGEQSAEPTTEPASEPTAEPTAAAPAQETPAEPQSAGIGEQIMDILIPAAQAEGSGDAEMNAWVEQQLATSAVQAQIDAETDRQVAAQADALMAQSAGSIDTMVEQQRSTVEAGVEAEVRKQVTAGVRQEVTNRITNMDDDTLNAQVEQQLASPDVQAQIESAVAAQMKSDAVKTLIADKVAEQMATPEVQSQITQNVKAQMGTAKVKNITAENIEKQRHSAAYLNGLAEALEENGENGDAYRSLADLLDTLDSVNTFYHGVIDYTDAVGTAADGAAELADGASQLADGAVELMNGMKEMFDQLTGFKDDQGEKLLDLLRGDIVNLPDRAEAVFNAVQAYQSFGGIADGMTGTTQFIFHMTL